MLRRERDNRLRRYVGVLVCIALGMAVGAWHNKRAARGKNDVVVSGVRTVTAPMVGGVSRVTDWFSREFGWITRGYGLDRENRALREENGRLREENAKLREADLTAQRLRDQLGFAEAPPLDKLACDIVSFRPNPSFETMIVSRGSHSGVAMSNVVVSPLGLVGQVYNITPTTADVMLLTDSSSSVGAMVQRSRVMGVCKGNGSSTLSMAYVDAQADVKAGDTVTSSGMGGAEGVYPKGWPIGTVTAVGLDSSGSTKRITIKPSVDFGRLEEVYVLKSAEPPAPIKTVPPVVKSKATTANGSNLNSATKPRAK